ncbi:MAG: thermonuclease family protein [Candidatus Omnitrophota bacterium]
MRKELKLIQISVLALALLVYAGSRFLMTSHRPAAEPAKEETVFVAKAVDGDTLKLSDGRRVRLLGVDTPELHYSEKLLRDARRSRKDIKAIQGMGERAADFTRRLCEGKRIRIETDIRRLDKYGRLLAYAYLDDGTFVNAKILEEGYGQVMTIPPNVKHADYFMKLQQEARERGKGLWGGSDSLF